MSDPTGIDAAALTVLLDLRNPASYLALAPTAAFGEELGLEINWLPLTVPPLRAPSEPAPDDDRSVLHRRHRARAIAREIETYGRAQGLVLRELYRDADASAFDLGWLWLRQRRDERLLRYLEAGFRTYWSLELDPSDLRAIESLLDEAGCDTRGFDAWCAGEGPRLASRIADALGERGLSGVPGFVVEDEFFQGRQHLPMIRWVLGGRQGPGPI